MRRSNTSVFFRIAAPRFCAGFNVILSLLLIATTPLLRAQEPAPEKYGLRRAVEEAWQKYPTIAAANAGLSAARSQVQVAQDAWLPNANVHLEVTEATRNNILGAVLPNQTIPPISGLAPNGPSARGALGSAVGVMVSWTAYDFGARRAGLELANAGRAEAEARLELVRYQLADAVADAWFRAAAAENAQQAATAAVTRWKTALGAVDVLVKAGLRPGADASRLRAELARSEAEELLAMQRTRQAQVELARYLMAPEKSVQPDAAWSMQPHLGVSNDGNAVRHPLLALRGASIEALSAEARRTEREWLPKIALYSAVSGRGSGARNDGSFRGGLNGIYPDTGNWAVGVGVSVDLFDWKRYRSRKEVRDHRVEEARAGESQVSVELRTLIEQARIGLETAQSIAAKMPEAVSASRELLTQSDIRYRSGLGTITELAEAQRTLQQSEVDDALAKISVWRAAFALAAARGELQRFLDQTP